MKVRLPTFGCWLTECWPAMVAAPQWCGHLQYGAHVMKHGAYGMFELAGMLVFAALLVLSLSGCAVSLSVQPAGMDLASQAKER